MLVQNTFRAWDVLITPSLSTVNGYLALFRAWEGEGGEKEEWQPHLSYSVDGTSWFSNTSPTTINGYGTMLTLADLSTHSCHTMLRTENNGCSGGVESALGPVNFYYDSLAALV